MMMRMIITVCKQYIYLVLYLDYLLTFVADLLTMFLFYSFTPRLKCILPLCQLSGYLYLQF